MREVMLTVEMPDGTHRLRRDLDFWELAEKAYAIEQELKALRVANAVQIGRIRALEKQLGVRGMSVCAK